MKFKLIFFLLLYCAGFRAGAQELRDINYYLGRDAVSKTAKDYYLGVLKPGDNDTTYSIADSMSTANSDTRPFYIYLVSRMLLAGQRGKAYEGLGIICRRYLKNEPDRLISFLYCNNGLVLPQFRNVWAKAVSQEIRLSCEGDPMLCLKELRTLALERCGEDNKQKLEVLLNMARSELKKNKGNKN